MQYFESGYNGQAWQKRKSTQDIFYFEMKACEASLDFQSELKRAWDHLRQDSRGFRFIDDGSLVAQAVRNFLTEDEIVVPPESSTWDLPFHEWLKNKFEISHLSDAVFLEISRRSPGYTVWPLCSGRIINVNYRRSTQQVLGAPYWTFRESERFHKVRIAALDLGIQIEPDLLKLTPQLMRAYFLHPLHMEMYQDVAFKEPHNDFVERQIWKNVDSHIENLYPTSRIPSNPAVSEASASFPVHTLLQKYFGMKNDFHKSERSWYGTTIG